MTGEQVTPNKSLAIFQPLSALERLDDEIIMSELQGEIVKEWVYIIPPKGDRPEIIDLSKVGVDECVNAMAHKGEALRELDVTWTVDGEYYNFVATVGRYAVDASGREVLLDTFKGFKRQWVKMRLRSGQVVPNEHFFEVGGIKATRNAKKRGITQAIRSAIINRAKKLGRVRTVADEEVETPEPGPSVTSGYRDWLDSCPEHNTLWETGAWGKIHKVTPGVSCTLNSILSAEMLRIVETKHLEVKLVRELIKRKFTVPFSSLKYENKIKALEFITEQGGEA